MIGESSVYPLSGLSAFPLAPFVSGSGGGCASSGVEKRTLAEASAGNELRRDRAQNTVNAPYENLFWGE